MATGRRMVAASIFSVIFNMIDSNRPTSPHLQIYKPQLTSILSISHRITGVILSLTSILIPISMVIIALGPDYHAYLVLFFSHYLVKLLLIGAVFTLIYHLCNGVRHLFWDYGYGLSIEKSYLSGYLVLFTSISITVLSVILVFRG